ncbi:hypothetical protein HanIR_Chr04g0171911 [Helianthus annuus]|nr:hypothetical protein HanIR_Chr04g0171911 [Helianthus annuus]
MCRSEDKMESLIHHENSKRLEIPQDYKEKEDQEITFNEESDKHIK